MASLVVRVDFDAARRLALVPAHKRRALDIAYRHMDRAVVQGLGKEDSYFSALTLIEIRAAEHALLGKLLEAPAALLAPTSAPGMALEQEDLVPFKTAPVLSPRSPRGPDHSSFPAL